MHAIVITEPGAPDVLRWQQVPDPPPGASPYLGLECSGRIKATGSDVTQWRAGDEVCALLAGGGYAGLVAVPQGQVLPRPASVGLAEAAALPEVVCTVYSNVFQLARLAQDELLLVHGGSSGIGTMAIQLAKAAGARVACTAGSPQKLERCRELGADITINYKTDDFVAAVHEAGGADVILDIIGAKYLRQNIDALAVNGRLAIIGMQGGTRAELNIAAMHAKRAALYATTLRARPPAEKAAIVQGVREDVWPLITEGQIAPVIDTELPMSEAAQAHRLMEASTHVGKILLRTPNRLGG
jgi:putative PIG3 family NAD(P)H quinone oxidoreductase